MLLKFKENYNLRLTEQHDTKVAKKYGGFFLSENLILFLNTVQYKSEKLQSLKAKDFIIKHLSASLMLKDQ